MAQPIRSYIALGSNLNHPIQQVKQARNAISSLPQTNTVTQAPLYQTKPLGPIIQSDFINTVVAVDTTLSPLELLQALQAIEQRQGRTRTTHWGPRTIDLDILLYGNITLHHKQLTLPHPEISNRDFVLYPLLAIAPKLILPNGEHIEALCHALKAAQPATVL